VAEIGERRLHGTIELIEVEEIDDRCFVEVAHLR
jgi:hypothetical protein